LIYRCLLASPQFQYTGVLPLHDSETTTTSNLSSSWPINTIPTAKR
jgi:hypothetical protein